MCLKLSQFQDKTQVFIKLAQQTSYISTCVNNNIFQNPNAIKLIMCYEIEQIGGFFIKSIALLWSWMSVSLTYGNIINNKVVRYGRRR